MHKQIAIRFLCFFFLLSGGLLTQAQPPWLPRDPSPAAHVSQTVGISTIQISYSRPAVKGRAIWGVLVPYGWDKQGSAIGLESPWRAGANENTVLHLSDPATIEGNAVPAGDYGLFFIVNVDNTGEVILSKDYKSWGSFFYNPKNDQMRAKITLRDLPASTERLTYSFDVLDHNMTELDLNWEKKQFPVKIAFAVDEIVMANAKELMNGQTGFLWQNVDAAANYTLTNKVDLDQGLKWADRAIGAQLAPSMGPYVTKAGILDLQGNHAEAEKILNDAMAKAAEGDLNNYGYGLLNNKQFDKAINAFKINTQRHPQSANTWDSLGEGYALSGDKQNAIASFKKSLSLNPPANVKANSEKYLKQLGAM